MLQNIVKLPSGFYALQWASTGEIRDTALLPWDGKRGTSYPYDITGESCEYYQTAEGTVYYTDKGGIDARIWCSASRLNAHCHHLHQVFSRR